MWEGRVPPGLGEASDDTHQLLDIVADRAAGHPTRGWRWLGARSVAEARSYYVQSLRRAWGVTAVREFARHRIRRVCFVGGPRRARAAQQSGGGEGG